MANTIQYVKKERSWQARYDPEAPKAGDLAPVFELLDTNGENRFSLSDFRGRQPVVLVFGSFT